MGIRASAGSDWRYVGYQVDHVHRGGRLSDVSRMGRTWLVDYHLHRIAGYSEFPSNRLVWTTYPTDHAFQKALNRIGSEIQEERRRVDRRRRDGASRPRLTR